jgi:NAD(P)H-hydrate epimerase
MPASQSWLLDDSCLETFLPEEKAWGYKGERGRLAIFAGSAGMTGAASLCSRAALASGAGYVALHSDPEILGILANRLEEVMVRPYPDPSEGFDAPAWDALLAGPGWKPDGNKGALLEFLLSLGLPAVLDAGAIPLFRDLSARGFRPSAPIVLTPHPGECAALCRRSAADILADPATILSERAKALGAFIVFKSHVTWIFSPGGEIRIWDGMESGLGTAGSGDVLAGLTAGLVAREMAGGRTKAGRGPDPAPEGFLSSACAAVIAHGMAGRELRKREGWFAAGRIVECAARILGSRSRSGPAPDPES